MAPEDAGRRSAPGLAATLRRLPPVDDSKTRRPHFPAVPRFGDKVVAPAPAARPPISNRLDWHARRTSDPRPAGPLLSTRTPGTSPADTSFPDRSPTIPACRPYRETDRR